jgi:hypothetical protein
MADKRQTAYTSEDIERGLFALALYGNAAEAERRLAATGRRVPKRTLQGWKTSHAERFREIASREAKKIREVIAQEQIEIAHAAGEAERVAIANSHRPDLEAQLRGHVHGQQGQGLNGPVDPSRSDRMMSTVSGRGHRRPAHRRAYRFYRRRAILGGRCRGRTSRWCASRFARMRRRVERSISGSFCAVLEQLLRPVA